MLIIGLILLLVGIFLAIPILVTVGIVALIVGGVLLLLGRTGRPVGGRRYWY